MDRGVGLFILNKVIQIQPGKDAFLNLVLERYRQEDLFEFKASLDYILNFSGQPELNH